MNFETAFWRHVDKDGPIPEHVPELGPCWVWTGATNPDGYGVMWTQGKTGRKMAHRLAWEFEQGPIEDDLLRLHRCDNPPCVRVSHLFTGTQTDNVADRHAKGRDGHRGPSRQKGAQQR